MGKKRRREIKERKYAVDKAESTKAIRRKRKQQRVQ